MTKTIVIVVGFFWNLVGNAGDTLLPIKDGLKRQELNGVEIMNIIVIALLVSGKIKTMRLVVYIVTVRKAMKQRRLYEEDYLHYL